VNKNDLRLSVIKKMDRQQMEDTQNFLHQYSGEGSTPVKAQKAQENAESPTSVVI
jgi:hypothetical protein